MAKHYTLKEISELSGVSYCSCCNYSKRKESDRYKVIKGSSIRWLPGYIEFVKELRRKGFSSRGRKAKKSRKLVTRKERKLQLMKKRLARLKEKES